MTMDSARQDDGLIELLQSYRPPAGVSDELLDPSGAIRPVWEKFIRHFAAMSADDITNRFAHGDQYLRDTGVFFRQYGEPDASERDWPLSHIPVIVDEDEWKGIAEGLVQRADLLEKVVADLYGPNQLIADGYLPATLIGRSPEWLRPLVGVPPRSDYFLHFVAFEIGRGPDGNWWVLGDRTQAPSGAGFALENRVATRRVFSEFFAKANVHRQASFFRKFRDALLNMRDNPGSRVGILTPGPLNDTYFEHAYIARYLGFMLLEGEDLTVEDGALMVRTVAGLSPVSVLWRRLDAAWTDPLELMEGSRLGTPGMTEAVRQGHVTMVNALGAGILETRALLAFLPRISEALLGAPLALPNIATWWCGQATARSYVSKNADKMIIGSALSTGSSLRCGGNYGNRRRLSRSKQGIARRVDRKRRSFTRRSGSDHPFHDAGLCGWCIGAPAYDTESVSCAHAGWLGGHERRLCADRPVARSNSNRDAIRRVCCRRLGYRQVSRDR